MSLDARRRAFKNPFMARVKLTLSAHNDGPRRPSSRSPTSSGSILRLSSQPGKGEGADTVLSIITGRVGAGRDRPASTQHGLWSLPPHLHR